MPIKFKCPECGEVLSVSSKLAGKSGKCKCGKQVKIPSPKKSQSAAQESTGKKQTVAAASGPSASMFDELTDQDFGRTNPYEKLYVSSDENNDAEQLSRFTQEEAEKKQKEAGNARAVLKIVAILSVLGFGFSIAMVVFFAINSEALEQIGDFVPRARLGQTLGIAFFSILAVLALTAAIGLFLNQFWGWIATAICCDFVIIERLGAIGVVIKEGFTSIGFYSAGGPLILALFLTMFVFKEESRTAMGLKSKPLMYVAIVLGFALGVGSVVAVFEAIKPPPPRQVFLQQPLNHASIADLAMKTNESKWVS
jgi:hypothetical protein